MRWLLLFLFAIPVAFAAPAGFSNPVGFSVTDITLTASDDAIYYQGWYSVDAQNWQSFTFPDAQTQGWILDGEATKKLPSVFTPGGEHYVLVYSCSRASNSWDCHGGQWQLQTIGGCVGGGCTLVSSFDFTGTVPGLSGGASLVQDAQKGRVFSPNNGVLRVPDSSSLDIQNAISLSSWVYLEAATINSKIVVKPTSGGVDPWEAYALDVYDGDVRFILSDGSSYASGGWHAINMPLSLHSWHHLAGTYDGNIMRLYIDGALIGSKTVSLSIVATNEDLLIGNFLTNYPLDGLIDDVQIYNFALSSSEVMTLYNGQASVVVQPTCNDGVQNQNESGIDCGGPCQASCGSPPVGQPSEFQTGWWIDVYGQRDEAESFMQTYADEGNIMVLLSMKICNPSWGIPYYQSYLDEAQKHGMKTLIRIVCEDGTPHPATDEEFTGLINAFKDHPTLYGFYIADEPGWTSDPAEVDRHYEQLSRYYPLAKQVAPDVPILITHSGPSTETHWNYMDRFLPLEDIYGIHQYPSRSNVQAEFGGARERRQYDIWKRGFETAQENGKDFIATCQGFGDNYPWNDPNPYSTPTYNELRHQVFTAVVLGIDKVLFWIDNYGEPAGIKPLVAQMISQMHNIGYEMNAGVTNDPRIGVSETNKDKLVYRYGRNGNRHVILAVNIANRLSTAGEELTVTFTLPPGATSVAVLEEERSIPVINGRFTDTFEKFEVHAYEFTLAS